MTGDRKRGPHVSLGWDALDELALRLAPAPFKVFVVLLRRAYHRTGEFRGSTYALAPKLGMAPTTVQRHLSTLEDLGLIEWKRGKNIDDEGVITIVGYDYWTGVTDAHGPSWRLDFAAAAGTRRSTAAALPLHQRLDSAAPSVEQPGESRALAVEAVVAVQQEARDQEQRENFVHAADEILQQLSETKPPVLDVDGRLTRFGFKVRDHAGLRGYLDPDSASWDDHHTALMLHTARELNGQRKED